MHDLETLRSGRYRSAGLVELKLSCPLDSFPLEILDLGLTLERLDLSGTGLSSLPSNFGIRLPNLRIAFFSSCKFETFPAELARCPNLEMVAFRSNGMKTVPKDALPARLRWLILTDNKLEALPPDIGRCTRLQKCMLAGNRLRVLPDGMAQCRKLGILRLSSNCLERLPEWLFRLPELAFLSFAGNPCTSSAQPSKLGNEEFPSGLPDVRWVDIEIQQALGEGASGVISRGIQSHPNGMKQEVAVKLFRGSLTSDGMPSDEMATCAAAGHHGNLISALGHIQDQPGTVAREFQGGLVMQLIPQHYRVLGLPPSLESCTRDCFATETQLSAQAALAVIIGIASAVEHLHKRGIKHGDLYAHNILIDEEGHAILGDFGAATLYDCKVNRLAEKVEMLAYSYLIDDVLGLIKPQDSSSPILGHLALLFEKCSVGEVEDRPTFSEIISELRELERLTCCSTKLPN